MALELLMKIARVIGDSTERFGPGLDPDVLNMSIAAAIVNELKLKDDGSMPDEAPSSDTGIETDAKTLAGAHVTMSPVTINFDTSGYNDAVTTLGEAALENARTLAVIASKLVPPEVKLANNQIGISIEHSAGVTVRDTTVEVER